MNDKKTKWRLRTQNWINGLIDEEWYGNLDMVLTYLLVSWLMLVPHISVLEFVQYLKKTEFYMWIAVQMKIHKICALEAKKLHSCRSKEGWKIASYFWCLASCVETDRKINVAVVGKLNKSWSPPVSWYMSSSWVFWRDKKKVQIKKK